MSITSIVIYFVLGDPGCLHHGEESGLCVESLIFSLLHASFIIKKKWFCSHVGGGGSRSNTLTESLGQTGTYGV